MDLSRQSIIMTGFKPEFWSMLIIGAGGIGSNAAYVATCMGFEQITVYEPDTVEEANVAPQFYSREDLGYTKTAALSDGIFFMTGNRIVEKPVSYLRQEENARIVICGVDSISIRRRIWKQNKIKDKLYWIDGRMGGTLCSVYAVDLSNSEKVASYEKSLAMSHSELPCGMKATAFLTKGMIQGMIGTALYHIVTDGNVPFLQVFDAKTVHYECIE